MAVAIVISGLSPRVRGNPAAPFPDAAGRWSIPACAGEPFATPATPSPTPVYPRVCGGTHAVRAGDRIGPGLSPRVRGNPQSTSPSPDTKGSIPACAGEPYAGTSMAGQGQVYPRVCGGTRFRWRAGWGGNGLSPRVRGNHNRQPAQQDFLRSIPACAGEPPRKCRRRSPCPVYPRVCGGTALAAGIPPARRGLSPRVRGNPSSPVDPGAHRRSIPACAGEPQPVISLPCVSAVYPRVCGGTLPPLPTPARHTGLSPRVRGNPKHFPWRRWRFGLSPRVRGNRRNPDGNSRRNRSIPACAGEPRSSSPEPSSSPVYPRVCGGTGIRRRTSWTAGGLSPRVRGNPSVIPGLGGPGGSIPACAGEPAWKWLSPGTSKVYPRVCGGTEYITATYADVPGLSPRVRGNRAGGAGHDAVWGSIPACAGEPGGAGPGGRGLWVYPRVCGGTGWPGAVQPRGTGLSPRVRGNLVCALSYGRIAGSIPACAGEPPRRAGRAAPGTVYPRVCGGTTAAGGQAGRMLGLSPRVRGNPPDSIPSPPPSRSIPACAGEPGSGGSGSLNRGVYPRVCGGTGRAVRRWHHRRGLSPRVRGNHAPLLLLRRRVGSIPACAGEPALRKPAAA